jgi:hypothetical protein
MTDPLWRMVRARSDHFLQKGNEMKLIKVLWTNWNQELSH